MPKQAPDPWVKKEGLMSRKKLLVGAAVLGSLFVLKRDFREFRMGYQLGFDVGKVIGRLRKEDPDVTIHEYSGQWHEGEEPPRGLWTID